MRSDFAEIERVDLIGIFIKIEKEPTATDAGGMRTLNRDRKRSGNESIDDISTLIQHMKSGTRGRSALSGDHDVFRFCFVGHPRPIRRRCDDSDFMGTADQKD